MAEWTKEQIIARIRGEAEKQKVDPDLAVAVATQESYLNPNAEGDNGNSLGLFQLQPAAAIDVGVNPQWRQDPDVNIYGGVRYLKQKLDQSKGDIPQALKRYNGGGDPNYVQNVLRFFKPGVAEAAERPQAGTYTDADVQNALKALQGPQGPGGSQAGTYGDEDVQNALKALQGLQEPSPPTSTSTPEQDAAYRASRGQQESGTAPQTAPAMAPQPGASQRAPGARLSLGDPGDVATPAEASATIAQMRQRQTPALERFLALPSIAQLTPAERQQVQQEFQAMPPDQQEQVIANEVPQDLRQAMAKPQESYPRGEGDTPRPGEKRPPTPTEAPVTEGITAPSTMIPLLLNTGVPGVTVAAPGLKVAQQALSTVLPKAGQLLTRGARAAGEGLSQTLGWTAGRTAETGQVPSPGEIGTEAALNVATGGVIEIPAALRDAKNAALRTTPGAQILLKNRAVQEAEGLGKRVFNAQDKEVAGKAFDAVAATGEKLDTAPVRDLWNTLTPTERRVATNELNKISSTFATSLNQRQAMNAAAPLWDIGELQHLRSELRKASMSKRTPETIDLLQSLRKSVDEAIHNGMAKGSLPAAELIEAQKAWRKVMQAEDLQGVVRKYTKDSPNLKYQELNLAGLNKEIRGGGKKATQRLVADMNTTERQVLQDELATLSKRYPFVRVASTVGSLASAGGLLYAGSELLSGDVKGASYSVLPAIMNAAARSPRFMALFKRSILDGKGQLSKHHVDALVNALRHENDDDVEAPAQ